MWHGLGALALTLALQLASTHGWSLRFTDGAGQARVCLQHDGAWHLSWCDSALRRTDPLRLLALLGRTAADRPPG